MLSVVELECVFCAVVDALLVGEEVCEYGHLGDDWAVLEDLLLQAEVLVLGETVVNHLVDHIVQTTLIRLQVLFRHTLLLSAVERQVTLCWDETFAFAPVQCAGDITTLASVVALVAVDDLRG